MSSTTSRSTSASAQRNACRNADGSPLEEARIAWMIFRSSASVILGDCLGIGVPHSVQSAAVVIAELSLKPGDNVTHVSLVDDNGVLSLWRAWGSRVEAEDEVVWHKASFL